MGRGRAGWGATGGLLGAELGEPEADGSFPVLPSQEAAGVVLPATGASPSSVPTELDPARSPEPPPPG